MVRLNEIRHGELAMTSLPPATDAGLVYIGRIHTPWTDRFQCPRQGRLDGPICRIDIFEPWLPALDCITEFDRLEVLYWLHESRRDLLQQSIHLGHPGRARSYKSRGRCHRGGLRRHA